jgi:hypothetical protein
MPDTDPTQKSSSMFAESTPVRAFPTTAVAIAAAAVVILAALLIVLGRRPAAPPAGTILPAAAYASNLIFSGVHMSDATNGSGGHIIYVDGHIANHGSSTVTSATVQVAFANDVNMPAQVETTPLNIVYMREPYVDTRPVNAAPLAPNAQADFRLIFDDVNDSWNQQLPQIRVTQAATR